MKEDLLTLWIEKGSDEKDLATTWLGEDEIGKIF
jgi:hypothetical protein